MAGKKKKDKGPSDDKKGPSSEYSYSYDSFDLEVEDNKTTTKRDVKPGLRSSSPVIKPVASPDVVAPPLVDDVHTPAATSEPTAGASYLNEDDNSSDKSANISIFDDSATSVGDELEAQDEVHKSLNALLDDLKSTKFDISILQSKIEARLVSASELQSGGNGMNSGAVIAVAANDDPSVSQEQLISPVTSSSRTGTFNP